MESVVDGAYEVIVKRDDELINIVRLEERFYDSSMNTGLEICSSLILAN